ncbi:HEAT repeat domain-containing protein [bacterium]|nr:HEAT repeat domain-containing protein [bacterium]
MKSKTVLVVCLALVVGCGGMRSRAARRAARRLQELAAKADRVRVRRGGPYRSDSEQEETLIEVKGGKEILDFAKRLKFSRLKEQCECSGDYTLEFYQRKDCLAMVSYHHATHLRWPQGWSGDAYLTSKSRYWLADWLAERRISYPKKEIASTLRRERIGKMAQARLSKVVPRGFAEGLEKAGRGFGRGREDREAADRARIEFIRSSLKKDEERFSTLFRIMGALPMSWGSWYRVQFLVNFYFDQAPAKKLDKAFRLAADSEDPAARRGAARVIFTQHEMERHGKTSDQIREWMMLLASEAFASPFPANRSLVAYRLGETKDERALDILTKAVRDSDAIVRRSTIFALAKYDNERARAVLEKVAAGRLTTLPGRSEEPLDFAKGEGTVTLFPRGMISRWMAGSDAEVARKALEEAEERRRNDRAPAEAGTQ